MPPEGKGPEPEPKGPLRRCIVTRESGPKEAMIRFVIGPGGTHAREIVPDLGGKLPGRGMWLSARADVLERAVSRGAFPRAARGQVHVPPDLRARIEKGLRDRLRDQVGLARRAGQAVCGFQQVREWLQAGRVGVLVEASDGSPSERARLAGRRDVALVLALTAEELGAVFGRDHAVHVAIAPGRIADILVQEAGRLAAVSSNASGAGT
ncbi:RNA-binding protein [Roseomonas sp. KE0001]|uniref:RNA-binding protein n=1 Tax=Roseomonas sp. KE0001 TaxID=2479201 RepID=UPI0021048FF8|nr:RNA-binding protein [Roseomonas sp. KE0001]